MTSLLTRPGGNPKTAKGFELHGHAIALQHFAPAKQAGRPTVCPWATKACIRGCLDDSGRAAILKPGETTNNIKRARKWRTRLYYDWNERYFSLLNHELFLFERWCKRKGVPAAVRLNGTADIPWEETDVINDHSHIQFYDYTKGFERMMAFIDRGSDKSAWPSNYWLTFSRTEKNWHKCDTVLQFGGNVAVVVADDVKQRYLERGIYREPHLYDRGWDCVDGDTHDFLPARGGSKVLLLTPKGKKMKSDDSGFVVRTFT